MKEHLIFAAKVIGIVAGAEVIGVLPWVRNQMATLRAAATTPTANG